MLKINEIFYSIQGESTYSGKPCVFVRLTYCNLRCTYCDSEYSFYEGQDMSIVDIIKKVDSYGCKLVEITGGEPLLQKESIILMNEFLKKKYTVMLETGGSLPITNVPKEVIKSKNPDVIFNALHGKYGEDGTIQSMFEYIKIPYTHSGVLTSIIAMDKYFSITF